MVHSLVCFKNPRNKYLQFNPIGTGGVFHLPLLFLEHNCEMTTDFFLKICDFFQNYIRDVLKPKVER